ncbi:hypothetical protein XI00_19530 [Bradyrhizobium sp. CCBAU 21359]|nr:hypothetical protein [Bradyrhizobium sp. CCBAU 21359]
MSPQQLELEITESVFLPETDANLATLHQLRGLFWSNAAPGLFDSKPLQCAAALFDHAAQTSAQGKVWGRLGGF